MDLDALAAARRAEWQGLDDLSRRRRLSGADVDELVTRYRAASADLADITTSAGRTEVGDHVATILARARLRLTGPAADAGHPVAGFFVRQLPAALYSLRWTLAAVAAGFLIVASLVAVWVVADPHALASLGSHADLQYYADHRFVGYYRQNPAAVFAGTVWTNNAWIAVQCVLFGITGVWPLYVVMSNAVGVGTAGAVMVSLGQGDLFWQFIAPHGMLELASVFTAAAAGLHVFWAWMAPGPRSRSAALAHAGRTLVVVAVGLVFSLALSGIVEGFVTPQHWPWPVKVVLGAMALGVFLTYMLGLGRRAARAGETGDLPEPESGTPRLVAG